MGKRRTFRFRVFLRRLFLGGLLLLLGLYGLLHTPWAQDRIAAVLSEKLSLHGQQVTLTELRGVWPFSLRAGTLSIEDPNGEWLRLENTSLRWQWRRKQILIQSLTCERLQLERIPELTDFALNQTRMFQMDGMDVQLAQLRVNQFFISADIAGQEVSGDITGSAVLNDREGLRTYIRMESEDIQITSDVSVPSASPAVCIKFLVNAESLHKLQGHLQREENLWRADTTLTTSQPALLLTHLQEHLSRFGVDTGRWETWLPEDPATEFPITLKTDLLVQDHDVSGEFHLEFAGGKLTAPLLMDPESETLSLTLQAEMEELRPISTFFGQNLEGRADGTATLKIQQETITFTGKLRTNELRQEGVLLGNSTLNVNGNDKEIEGGLHHQLTLAGKEIDGSSSFTLRPEKEGWAITVPDMELTASPLVLKTREPFTVSLQPEGFTLPAAALTLNGIPLTLEGSGNPEDLEVSLRVPEYLAEELPDLEGLSLNGALSGGITLSGNWEQPVADLTCSFENLSLLLEDADTRLQLSGKATGRWTPEGLSVNARATDNQENHVQMDLSSPAGWSLSPLNLPDEEADFTAGIKGRLNLSVLNRFQILENQRITGLLETDLQVERRNGVPDLTGNLRLEEGAYDHFRLGSRFQKLQLDVQMENHKLTLKQATGRTPGGGTLSAEGQWNLTSLPGSGSLRLKFNNARLLHLDPVQAAVSGNVTVNKTEDPSLTLGGNLVLENTVFDMDRLPRPVPRPVLFTVKGASEIKPVEQTSPEASPVYEGLNARGEISLRIPSSLIVKGQNVYSTWMGDFKLGLQPEGLQLNGKLNPRRGTVVFFGRTFRLSKGTVHFNDRLGSSPILDLEAEYSREDLDAVLLITGKVDDPTFRLRSNPPLPQDEVLSRILFGKDMASITGLQALEVGLALRSMMDSGDSDWDFMGKARDFLNVDQLELRESGDTEGSAELVAGRQINNRLYLEFNQSLKEPGTSIILEYEIRRNLSISTETGTHTLPGIGVNWKRDY